jgi:hypothetical protein
VQAHLRFLNQQRVSSDKTVTHMQCVIIHMVSKLELGGQMEKMTPGGREIGGDDTGGGGGTVGFGIGNRLVANGSK